MGSGWEGKRPEEGSAPYMCEIHTKYFSLKMWRTNLSPVWQSFSSEACGFLEVNLLVKWMKYRREIKWCVCSFFLLMYEGCLV